MSGQTFIVCAYYKVVSNPITLPYPKLIAPPIYPSVPLNYRAIIFNGQGNLNNPTGSNIWGSYFKDVSLRLRNKKG
jgi:hypothetical protein